MKIFTRYILGEVASHAAIGASLFTFVIFMRDLGRLLEIVVRNSAPIPSVAEIFFLTLPTAATVTIPMGLLVGVLLGLSRLAADSEITAMRASGLGAWMFVRVISWLAVAVWLFAIVNSVWIAPRSSAALARLQDKLKTSQASFEIQPRVFYEDLKNKVLYVENVKTGNGASVWNGIFLADVSDPSAPKITLARDGIVVSEHQDSIRMHLENGSEQEVQPKAPEQYQISTFSETDIPIEIPPADASKQQDLVPVSEMSTQELWYRGHHPEVNTGKPRNAQDTPVVRARWYLVEFYRRLALPTSCLVLTLVGIPLGLSSKKGGKSMGFVLTIVLVFLYYFATLAGISLGRAGKLSPGVGVWMANVIFLIAGFVLLRRVERASVEIGSLAPVWEKTKAFFTGLVKRQPSVERSSHNGRHGIEARNCRWKLSARFPLLIDELILRDFGMYLGMILTSFILLTLIFTFFELLGDIVRNKISILVVGSYLLNVTPSMIYTMTPLSVLLAVLVTFGLMQKSNEITAMKATGTSVYRVIFPIFIIAGAISVGLFMFDQFYIPEANQRQETIRNQIKGKPAQTYLRPDRKWIFGEHNTIYYYEFFDADQNKFANITAFQFDPKTFELVSRVYASRAHWSDEMHKWIFEQGWTRNFEGSAIKGFQQFDAQTFAYITEDPAYFKKEVRQSSEMNYGELRSYIADLQQSGFDVVRLRVQLQKKFAYPLITLIMAVLAVPFSLSAGRKGALTGVAVALLVAIIYFVTSGLFEAMGNASQLPAALAAWAPDLIFGFVGGYMILKVPT